MEGLSAINWGRRFTRATRLPITGAVWWPARRHTAGVLCTCLAWHHVPRGVQDGRLLQTTECFRRDGLRRYAAIPLGTSRILPLPSAGAERSGAPTLALCVRDLDGCAPAAGHAALQCRGAPTWTPLWWRWRTYRSPCKVGTQRSPRAPPRPTPCALGRLGTPGALCTPTRSALPCTHWWQAPLA